LRFCGEAGGRLRTVCRDSARRDRQRVTEANGIGRGSLVALDSEFSSLAQSICAGDVSAHPETRRDLADGGANYFWKTVPEDWDPDRARGGGTPHGSQFVKACPGGEQRRSP
jgi:hypothetical protein